MPFLTQQAAQALYDLVKIPQFEGAAIDLYLPISDSDPVSVSIRGTRVYLTHKKDREIFEVYSTLDDFAEKHGLVTTSEVNPVS